MLRDFTKDKFDILIQAGQSNSEGAGFGSVEEPYRPDERVWYLNQNGMLTLAAEEVWYNDARGNFALPFGPGIPPRGDAFPWAAALPNPRDCSPTVRSWTTAP